MLLTLTLTLTLPLATVWGVKSTCIFLGFALITGVKLLKSNSD